MAADDFQVIIESLHYERQRLSALVFEPLQEIKDFIARNLRSDEVAGIVGFLGNAIRSDTLRNVTDGEALIAVLNLYYGKDNLRVLQRLLKKINCHDLLEILNDWEVRKNPVDPRVFRECGYFPLWIRIKSNFTWFSENKKRILQSIGRLFRIPEITPGDPDYETVIYMGVSFGKTDLLIYVLLPLCTCNYIRTSLGRNDVCLAFQQLNISGVYFSRSSEKNGFSDDLSSTSFTSINESISGDYIKQSQILQDLHPSKTPLENKKNGLYSGIHGQHQYFHDTDLTHSSQREEKKELKVVRASVGYIDAAPSVLNPSPVNKTVEPVRVVRPKIMYLDHSKVPVAMDVEDSPKKSPALDKGNDLMIVKQSIDMVEQNPQSFKKSILQEESEGIHGGKFQQKLRRENFSEGDVESLIVPEVKHYRKAEWKFPDELTHTSNGEHAAGDINGNFNSYKWSDYGRSDNGKRGTSVLNFSEGGNNDEAQKVWQAHRSPQNLLVGSSEQSSVTESASSMKPWSLPAEKSTKSGNKKLYTSTATLQVNVGSKSANCQGQPVNGEIYKSEAATSFNMSKPDFNGEEVSFKESHSLSNHTQNGDSTWYEDTALSDYYREMIPEPEPGNPQHCYQNEEFYQHKMIPKEEASTDYHSRARNGGAHTPLYSPPEGFRDATLQGSKLVKVKTKFFEQPVQLQQAALVSTNNENRTLHDWDSSSLESSRLRQITRPPATTENDHVNRVAVHSSSAYNHDRLQPVFVHPRPFLMKSESKLESEYEDSVFTDTESHGDMTFSRGGPPPYLPPPEYNGTAQRSTGKLSDDSISADTFDHSYKSNLLSAASVSSIFREKEMFLNRDELQRSIKGAEDKEMEKQMELCKELFVAAKGGDEEEVKRIIDEGVDVDYQNEFGQSALMVASWEGHLGVVDALLRADADPNLQDGFGKSALHQAALSGHHTIVNRLIPGGAQVNLIDEEHRTALHYAAMRGKRRIVEILMLFRADVTLFTKFGESAVELAYVYHHDDIVEYLMSSGDKKTRREMESQIRKQKLRQMSSATSLPNLSKVSSVKELSRSRSRPDLRKKKSVCSMQ